MALAEERLADLIQDNFPRTITPEMILEAVGETFGFSVDELVGPKRVRPLVTARHVAMYLVRSLTDYSYPMIGRIFGGRDHTTCINACSKIEGQMGERQAIYDQVTKIEASLRNNA
jgi:chromosomal replication initiator protein